MPVIVPPAAQNWLNSPAAKTYLATMKIPPNLAVGMAEDLQRKIILYINQRYAWPQIQERGPFERIWDACYQMYLVKIQKAELNLDEASPAGRAAKGKQIPTVSDSVIHDAVERLVDITTFVSFKESMPVQFNVPDYFNNAKADQYYDPTGRIVQGANALLAWNFQNESVFRKYMATARCFYLYGVAFASSNWVMEASQSMRQGIPTFQWQRIGTTFDPISIRKIWLNWRLPAYNMDYQPCPFYFEDIPFYAIRQSAYNAITNPFGFANLEQLGDGQQYAWVFSDTAMSSMQKALTTLLDNSGAEAPPSDQSGRGLVNLLKEENGVTGLWHFFPMLPYDPQTGDFEYYNGDQTKPVPFRRFIVNLYGQNFSGRQALLRIQENFYPNNSLPLYASSHMPDLDSGAYTPSLGQILWNHYKELAKCMEQYITNKDWVNNPPSWKQVASPAFNKDINEPGTSIPVNGPNDFGWREPFDATASTSAILQFVREGAQTTSKSTDALLGKAMGSRTSATEANNAFQASMSAVTTPINLFNSDMMGGFAQRVYDYSGAFMPEDILKAITGSKDMQGLKPEDLHLRIGMKTDTGSSFVESIVRQTNIRYVLESSAGDPSVRRAAFWKMLFKEFKFPQYEELIDDGGLEREIEIATEQAINCFTGKPDMVNPDQNHDIAIRVKTRFLEDKDSRWMTEFQQNAGLLIQQIQMHTQFQMLQLQEQLAHMALGQSGLPSGMLGGLNPALLGPGGTQQPGAQGPAPMPGAGPGASGAASQQGGGRL